MVSLVVTRRSARGFSLLEVLVAMSIFALIGLGANQMLRTIIDSREATSQASATFADSVLAIAALDRDFTQLSPRGVRDRYGEQLPAFALAGASDYRVELTRAGWNNPLQQQRSSLQRVAYDLQDERLLRYTWLVLDRAEDSEPREQVLLGDVTDLRISALDSEGASVENWPAETGTPSPLPRLIEVVIVSASLGEVRRVYPQVVVAPLANNEAEGDNGQNAELEEGG